MNLLVAMSTFVEVARTGGFSAAARKLDLSTTPVSRQVAELETRLGTSLLRRTTRQVSLTDAGHNYLHRAIAILDEVERLDNDMQAVDRAFRGRLRISAPPAIGREWIAPLVVEFVEANPGIDLDLELTERVVDLVAEGFDAAIRAGPLPSSSFLAHRIIEVDYVLCASPAYVARPQHRRVLLT